MDYMHVLSVVTNKNLVDSKVIYTPNNRCQFLLCLKMVYTYNQLPIYIYI